MEHDFDHGTDCTGIMDYGNTPDVWSACSQSDFRKQYIWQATSGGGQCMKGKSVSPTHLSIKTTGPPLTKFGIT